MTSISARVDVTVDEFHLRADLDLQEGTVALLGPNGSGKSTLVRALAGLLDVPKGEIVVDGRPWLQQPGGIDIPPQERSIGVVFQDLALFPNMSVADNVAYGLRSRGASRSDSTREAIGWLDRFDAGHLAGRRARTLSGGEAQKVALTRALILEPDLLLLDEPLSSLDVENREEARHFLASVLRDVEGVKVIVTHDPVEAFALADSLAIMEVGRVLQVGSPAEISLRPRSRYAAKVAGVNLLRGRLIVRDGLNFVRVDGAELSVVSEGIRPGDDVFATFPANAVTLAAERSSGSARNTFRASVVRVEVGDGRTRIALEGPVPVTAELTVRSVEELAVRPGAEFWVAIKATEIEVYRA
jgi:molybdate transport system ATP-binding protein